MWMCSSADAEMIEADLAAEERVSGLAHTARQRRRVVARRGHGTAHWQLARIIGHGAMVRRSRAGRGLDARRGTQRNAARAMAMD